MKVSEFWFLIFSPILTIRDVSYRSLLDSLMDALCLSTPCRPLLLRLAGAPHIGDAVIEVSQISFCTVVFSEHQDPRGMLKKSSIASRTALGWYSSHPRTSSEALWYLIVEWCPGRQTILTANTATARTEADQKMRKSAQPQSVSSSTVGFWCT